VTVGSLPSGFYIEDDGEGIQEDMYEQVFELGYSPTGESTESGIGIASAQQIAVAHGWSITATEIRTGGARFEVADADMP